MDVATVLVAPALCNGHAKRVALHDPRGKSRIRSGTARIARVKIGARMSADERRSTKLAVG
jgi:hypothetical protein